MKIKKPQIDMYLKMYSQYKLLFGTNKSQRVEDLENLSLLLELSDIQIENCLELFSGAGETKEVWDLLFPNVTLYETDLFGACTGRTNFENFYEGDVVEVLSKLVDQGKTFDLVYIPHNSLASNFVTGSGKDFDFAKASKILNLVSQLTNVFVYGNKDIEIIDSASGLVEVIDRPATLEVLKAFGAEEDGNLKDPQFYAETYQTYNPVNSIYQWEVVGGLYEKGKLVYGIQLPFVYKYGNMNHVTSLVESLSTFKTKSIVGYDADDTLRFIDSSTKPTHSELVLSLFLFIDP